MSFQSATFLSTFPLILSMESSVLLSQLCWCLCLLLTTGLLLDYSQKGVGRKWKKKKLCEQRMKGNLLNCRDGKESHTKAGTCCCPCGWKSKITAFECLGYAEFHIWVFVCMSVIHGIKFGSDSVLLFLYFQLFFLSLALLDLAEKNKQDYMSTMFKTFRESSQCRWYGCVHKLTYWASLELFLTWLLLL